MEIRINKTVEILLAEYPDVDEVAVWKDILFKFEKITKKVGFKREFTPLERQYIEEMSKGLGNEQKESV